MKHRSRVEREDQDEGTLKTMETENAADSRRLEEITALLKVTPHTSPRDATISGPRRDAPAACAAARARAAIERAREQTVRRNDDATTTTLSRRTLLLCVAPLSLRGLPIVSRGGRDCLRAGLPFHHMGFRAAAVSLHARRRAVDSVARRRRHRRATRRDDAVGRPPNRRRRKSRRAATRPSTRTRTRSRPSRPSSRRRSRRAPRRRTSWRGPARSGTSTTCATSPRSARSSRARARPTTASPLTRRGGGAASTPRARAVGGRADLRDTTPTRHDAQRAGRRECAGRGDFTEVVASSPPRRDPGRQRTGGTPRRRPAPSSPSPPAACFRAPSHRK